MAVPICIPSNEWMRLILQPCHCCSASLSAIGIISLGIFVVVFLFYFYNSNTCVQCLFELTLLRKSFSIHFFQEIKLCCRSWCMHEKRRKIIYSKIIWRVFYKQHKSNDFPGSNTPCAHVFREFNFSLKLTSEAQVVWGE